MLQIKSLHAYVKMDPADLRRVLTSLSDTDWKPALFESQKRVLELAGLSGQVALPIARPFSPYGPHLPSDALGGDIFFRGDDVFFLLTSHGESEMMIRRSYALSEVKGTQEPGTEVGIMTNDRSEIDKRLNLLQKPFNDSQPRRSTVERLDTCSSLGNRWSWEPRA
ncbi:MAG: hypothetical protein K9N21_15580 [Deltaproteobacteria bacterium]|nr:hypothetical protein [Deltaproteobacteria bacterium]